MRKLEEIKLTDKEEVLALYHSFIGQEGCTWSDAYPDSETFEMDVAGNNLFGIRENNKIISVISIDQDEIVDKLSCWTADGGKAAEIARLAVDRQYQNKGIAGIMIIQLCKILEKRGYNRAHYMVYPFNKRALAAYKRLDFDFVGECNVYDHHWLCYEKQLGGAI